MAFTEEVVNQHTRCDRSIERLRAADHRELESVGRARRDFGADAAAFAANDPIAAVNNLSDFIFGLIRAVGLILLGWGIVQVGLSFQSHDPSQRSNGFLTLAGGIVITFAKEILNLITG